MPWSRDAPDPLRSKRRQLASQEKELALRMSRLNEELRNGPRVEKKEKQHPVWRLEDEISPRLASETTSAKRRNLARQTRRDKMVFFGVMAILAVSLLVFFWIYETHSQSM